MPTMETPADRRQALEGADFVICLIQVAGYQPGTVIDFEIPKKYGLRHTISDTLGVGGIMRGLRTIPVLLGICRDIEQVAPQALLLNHVNPLAINGWALTGPRRCGRSASATASRGRPASWRRPWACQWRS